MALIMGLCESGRKGSLAVVRRIEDGKENEAKKRKGEEEKGERREKEERETKV